MRFQGIFCILGIVLAVFVNDSAGEDNLFPEDLKIEVSRGGLSPWEENCTTTLSANGSGRCTRYIPEKVGEPPISDVEFQVSEEQLAKLWEVLNNNSFFELRENYTDETVAGGEFIAVSVQANQAHHQVTVENMEVEAITKIAEVISLVTHKDCEQ